MLQTQCIYAEKERPNADPLGFMGMELDSIGKLISMGFKYCCGQNLEQRENYLIKEIDRLEKLRSRK